MKSFFTDDIILKIFILLKNMQIQDIHITYLGHAGFMISNGLGKIIAIDPYKVSSKSPKADIVLITHPHFDHCSVEDIQKLVKHGTIIVMPNDVQPKIEKIKDIEIVLIESGEKLTFGKVEIEAVPAYNTNKPFHPKEEGWIGYVIKCKNVIFYHAGDSDKIPEMKNLVDYRKCQKQFIAMLPVSGKYVMDAIEAAEVACLLSPHLAIPMHYGAGVVGTIEDAKKFIECCKEKGVKAKILIKS